MPNDERRTPRWLFDIVNHQFQFTVDAAATTENALCAHYWTQVEDGLKQSWNDDIVWCNPPYSRGQLIQWVTKAASSEGKVVMLLPGDCSTKAGQMALHHASAVLFIAQRIAFDDEEAGAKFSNWLALFGITNRRDLYRLYNMKLGVVL